MTISGGISPASLERASSRLVPADREFFGRVWATDPAIYRARLGAAGMDGCGTVLDAGAGMGQWTVELAACNQRVVALDVADSRCQAIGVLRDELALANVAVTRGSIDRLPFADGSFDGVWCFSAVYFVDVERAFREFHRVLRPGGRLYATSDASGYFVHNLLRPRNASAAYSARADALGALAETVRARLTGRRRSGQPIAVGRRRLLALARRVGFDGTTGPEGTGTVGPPPGRSFYPDRAFGLDQVIELLASRSTS